MVLLGCHGVQKVSLVWRGMDFQSTTTVAAKFYNPKKSRKVTFTMQQQK